MFDVPLHKLIVHFPIALTIIALGYDAWALYYEKPEFHGTGYGLTVWAAVTSLIAVVSGLLLAGVTRIDQGAITGHSMFGIAAGVFITAAGFLRYSARARNQTKYRTEWLILQVGAALLISAAAITGHRLFYGN